MGTRTGNKPVLAVFGVGLIGGSLAIDLKAAEMVNHVIGVGRSLENLEKAQARGVIDEICDDPGVAVGKADVVVLATPVNTINDLLKKISPYLSPDKVVTDVGSVKSGILESAREHLGDHFRRFVPGHPVAGKEKSGIDAAAVGLYENHKVILTPTGDTDADAVELVHELWASTGAQLSYMDPVDHDRILSITSHLPHMLAYVMMDFLATSSDPDRCFEMAAGGFYDFTRTASSDPEMWRDIALMNRREILDSITAYQGKLSSLAEMINSGDGQGIEQLFAGSRKARARVKEKRRQS